MTVDETVDIITTTTFLFLASASLANTSATPGLPALFSALFVGRGSLEYGEGEEWSVGAAERGWWE
jgi:hypothetical protein